jgi:hypothetical protein
MCGEHYNLIVKGRYDKLYSVRRNAFNTLLNHMVSILVTHTPHNMSIQLRHQLCLLINIYNFQCLLNNSAAIHLEAEYQNMSHQLICQIRPLLGCAMLKKLHQTTYSDQQIPLMTNSDQKSLNLDSFISSNSSVKKGRRIRNKSSEL